MFCLPHIARRALVAHQSYPTFSNKIEKGLRRSTFLRIHSRRLLLHVIYHVKLLNSVPMHIRNHIGVKVDCNRFGPNRIECEIVRCELKTELVHNVKRPLV